MINTSILAYLGESEIILIVVAALFIFCGVAILLAILYLKTLKSTFDAVSPENQKMKPNAVWMILIPCFGMVWQFIVVKALSDSLKAEYIKRNITDDGSNFAYKTGFTSSILNCCTMIPYLGVIIAIVAMVFWIIYWSKMVNYKNSLVSQL